MIFSLLTFASAFLIEGLGTWISIIGLSSLFSADPIIIALAAALDVGKVVTVSFLYKRWSTAPRVLRFYMIVATAVLMAITSAGAFGYLSAAFQGAIKDTKQQQILVTAAMEEKAKLEARKKEIDAQIANLPSHIVQGRQKLISAFKGEADRINLRLRQLDAELPKMRAQQITINTHTGPIVYISEAFNVSVEQAVKYVILIIIFVFDPLAIALLVAGNFLWETRKKELPGPADASERSDKAVATRSDLAAAVAGVTPPDMANRVDVATRPDTETPHRGELADAVPAATPTELAGPVRVSIPGDKASEESTALHAEVQPQAIHLVKSQNQSEPPAIQASEPISPEVAVTANEQIHGYPDPEQAIRETAYYLAEKRAFKDGAPADDWVRAEKVIVKGGLPAG
ncbi:MAG: DUF2934 domain-containing protein [Propionivibrio sp.]|uniref:DUF2934 domain-containing protein n=1 Tax=Propionivibrio sp. TaxID=2212460 RepID=UPI001A4A025A|nr:DUF2934 domain-containing protein [Propionivibrio sp.]MBL8414427.1 DUF2934 domain-containing protein [Propionivibrio sp.]